MSNADVIKTLLTVAMENEKNLLKRCMEYPVPKTDEEAKEAEELMKHIEEIKKKTPHGKPYAAMHRNLTWCKSEIYEKISDYNFNKIS